jgi:sulfite reductase (ferredoxin)
VGVVHPELGPGYDLWVAGALSVQPYLGQRLGVA